MNALTSFMTFVQDHNYHNTQVTTKIQNLILHTANKKKKREILAESR